MLARLQFQHELAERSLKGGKLVPQHHEPRSRQLGGSGEVHAQPRSYIVVWPRVEGKIALLSPTPQLDIAVLIRAIRDVVRQQIGKARHGTVETGLKLAQALLTLFHPLLQGRHLGQQLRRRRLALARPLPDLTR